MFKFYNPVRKNQLQLLPNPTSQTTIQRAQQKKIVIVFVTNVVSAQIFMYNEHRSFRSVWEPYLNVKEHNPLAVPFVTLLPEVLSCSSRVPLAPEAPTGDKKNHM